MAAETQAAGNDGDIEAIECGDSPGIADPTVCARCVNLVCGKGEHWWKWTCFASPRQPRFNPVTGQTVAEPAYHFCRELNKFGDCPMYSEGPNTLHPKEMPECRKP